MTKPVVMASTLVTDDRVPIEAIHLPGNSDLAIVVAHGFTLSWQRPNVWRIANRLNEMAGVLTFDFRGHGRSGGLSTLGDREINDLDVVVRWARELGYQRVAAVGFSMGASIVLRYAGLVGGLDAVVSVSGPGRWYYRGTQSMRWVHRAVERRVGRYVTRWWLKTRISPEGWKLVPVPPAEELWLVPGMGHAESACGQELVDRIGRWIGQVASPALPRDDQGQDAAASPDEPAAQTPDAAA